MKLFVVLLGLVAGTLCARYYQETAEAGPSDPYHVLHLPHDPPLYPTYHAIPRTGFSCIGLRDQLWADLATECQGYHLCMRGQLVASQLCTNGTLFNQQFQVCDQFYNVRCGSLYEDL